MICRMIQTKINQLLEQRGKTLYWLAKETNTAYSTIHKLAASATDSISFRVLEAICVSLECEIGDVLEIVPEKKGGKQK